MGTIRTTVKVRREDRVEGKAPGGETESGIEMEEEERWWEVEKGQLETVGGGDQKEGSEKGGVGELKGCV